MVNNGLIIVANSDFHDGYNWWFLWDYMYIYTYLGKL